MRLRGRAGVSAVVALLFALLPTGPAPALDTPRCTVLGTPSADVLRGTAQDDVLCGRGGADTLHGGGGNDVLLGGHGRGTLYGGGGADVYRGGPDGDRLVDASGSDSLVGGTRVDVVGDRERVGVGKR